VQSAASDGEYAGSVHWWGDCVLTPEHKVLTDRGWLPGGQVGDEFRVMHAQVGSAFYTGRVFDLSVAGSHSFFADGIAIHNCVYHHRGPGGAHTASHSDWEAGQYVPALISPFAEKADKETR
jgi:hypothetical protein